MADRIELLREARKRGILPPDQIAALEEFEKRGLDKPDSTAVDVGKSFGVGVAEGAIGLAGLPGDVREGVLAGVSFLAEKLGVDPETAKSATSNINEVLKFLPPTLGGGRTSGQIQSTVESVTGEFRKPQTTAGEFARTIGQFAPAAVVPGSLAARAGQVVIPAVASETAGQLSEGTDIEPFARVAAAILGGGTISAARRAITPTGKVDPEIAAQVVRLEERGVTAITAGQRTGNPVLTKRESLSPETFAGATLDRGQEQFTQAALRLAGIEAKRATPDVVDSAFKNIGREFDAVQARNKIIIPPQTKTAIRDAIKTAGDALAEGRLPKAVKKLPKRLANITELTGTQYKETRSRLTDIIRNTSKSDSSRPVSRIVDLLDQAAEASIQVTNPRDLGRFRELRGFYQNLLVIEKAASRAGKEAALGIITPAGLQSATRVIQGSRALSRGTTEAGTLSSAGVGVLQRPPSSGTPEGLISRGLGRSIASIPGDLARSASLTRLGQSALGNQRFSGPLGGVGGIRRSALSGALATGNE